MAEEDQQERTEEATEQRREDFRKRGQVAYTRELGSVFLLAGSAAVMWMMARFLLTNALSLVSQSVGDYVVQAARGDQYLDAVKFAGTRFVFLVGPLIALLGVAAFLSSVMQFGFLYNEEALTPDFTRLDPIAGVKRMFSLQSLVEGIKACFKVVLVLGVVYLIMRSQVGIFPRLGYMSISQEIVFIGEITLKLLAGVAVLLAILATADFFFQKWQLNRQMRMTKEEVKAEHKAREGDPLIKARIRRVQKEIANRRMMDDVRKADVIITNPTHIAVALKYDETMVAPKLLAKGADRIAEKIKEVARESNIPIVENKPLARTIYKTLKIGQTIPRELFMAVAQVLSYVYRLKRRVIN